MRCLIVVLVSLVVSTQAWAENPWAESKGVATHTPTGLSFPDKLGDLERSPVGPSTNPHSPGAVSVSYGWPPARLMVMLIPAEPAPDSDPRTFLDARFDVLQMQFDTARKLSEGEQSMTCASEPIDFSELRVGLPDGEQSQYAAQFKGHLVLLQSRMAPGGVPLSIQQVVEMLGWPCAAVKAEG